VAGRRLTPDEAALWQRVRASVRPIERRIVADASMADLLAVDLKPAKRVKGRVPVPLATPAAAPTPLRARSSANTLDGGWDKRLSRGSIVPDRTIDLHGYSLAMAHAVLEAEIGDAVSCGDRVILLVTGKPPRPESEHPHARGAIRASIADWLAGSRHAGRIAAVRAAHPRHGGAGALYVILRRSR
jgi:DNA-nicking Smr family endonuclease